MSALAPVDLLGRHDALLVDLDGTLLLAGDVIPAAPEAISAARSAGLAVLVVTNNASRFPADVAERLSARGMRFSPDEVVTSPQAAAAMLAGRHPAGALVLVVGAAALAHAVEQVGLRTTRSADDHPVAVVQGFDPNIGWRDLAEACLAIREGVHWVATNADSTLPTDRGILPGNGSLIAALATAAERYPDVAGKPERPLLDEAVRRAGATHPLVIGDRLGTDIAAAARAGMDSLMVLTGVSSVADVLATEPALRPTYVSADMRGLTGSAPVVVMGDYADRHDGDAALREDLTRLSSGALAAVPPLP